MLDQADFQLWVGQRYASMKQKQVVKTAKALFRHIDIDCSGGITLQEFSEFCRSTPVFLMYAHGFQTTMREKLFTDAYWKRQTEARARTSLCARRSGAIPSARPPPPPLQARADIFTYDTNFQRKLDASRHVAPEGELSTTTTTTTTNPPPLTTKTTTNNCTTKTYTQLFRIARRVRLSRVAREAAHVQEGLSARRQGDGAREGDEQAPARGGREAQDGGQRQGVQEGEAHACARALTATTTTSSASSSSA